MNLSHWPNGISSMGIPIVGSGTIPVTKSTYWFIDGVEGSDGDTGADINHPLKTIGNAIARASEGDVLLAFPASYNENLSVTSLDYIQLMGILIPGYARPDVTPSSGAALIVHSQGFRSSHVRFAGAGVGGIGVQQMGNGFLFDDCVFESDSNIGFRMLPDVDNDRFTASEGQVLNSLIRDCAGGGMSFENPGPVAGVGCTDNLISGCRFYGNTGADIFDVYTAGGNNKTFSTSIIANNYFATKNPTKYIDLSAGTANDGLISENFFAFTTAGGLTVTQIVLGNSIAFAGNYDAVGLVDGHTF